MKSMFDLVIIGSGSAATTVAFRALKEGKKVAVIDQKPIGGTCALRGCDPKKILVGVTESLESARRLQGHGISNLRGGLDWGELMEFKRSFTEPMSKRIEDSIINGGIQVLHGKARFLGPNLLDVQGETLESEKFLIASGVKAAALNFPGSEYLIDNEGFLSLPNLLKILYLLVEGTYLWNLPASLEKQGLRLP